MKEEYQKLINIMASHYDLYEEMPNMYSEEFQKAVCHKLLKDEAGMQYTHYRYLPLFNRDYQFPELLKTLCDYIKAEGDIEEEKKISKKLADILVKNITLYFREDIEDDIERECRNKYKNMNPRNWRIYVGHSDLIEA